MFQRQEEFERATLPHLRALLRFARRLEGGPSIAEDLVQETFLLAWRGFGRFEPGSNVRAWLFRILINAHLGQGRKKLRSPVVVGIEDAAGSTGASDPERLEVIEALDRLPEDQRTVLLLSIVDGFTCREIADILSIPAGTAMSRLSRARHAMRTMLSPQCEKASL